MKKLKTDFYYFCLLFQVQPFQFAAPRLLEKTSFIEDEFITNDSAKENLFESNEAQNVKNIMLCFSFLSICYYLILEWKHCEFDMYTFKIKNIGK